MAVRSGPILMLLACVVGQGRARTDHRRGGFWRWRRFMREPVGRRRPGLAG